MCRQKFIWIFNKICYIYSCTVFSFFPKKKKVSNMENMAINSLAFVKRVLTIMTKIQCKSDRSHVSYTNRHIITSWIDIRMSVYPSPAADSFLLSMSKSHLLFDCHEIWHKSFFDHGTNPINFGEIGSDLDISLTCMFHQFGHKIHNVCPIWLKFGTESNVSTMFNFGKIDLYIAAIYIFNRFGFKRHNFTPIWMKFDIESFIQFAKFQI